MMLEVNQLSFSSDGCLIAYTLLRHLLEENPNFVVAATDEHTAFQLQKPPVEGGDEAPDSQV